MARSLYGVPLDLYADDEELDPLKDSPLEPTRDEQFAALDSIAKPPAAEDDVEPVALPAATPATGGSGPVARAPGARVPARGYAAGLGGEDLARAQGQDRARNAARDTSDAIYATFARKEMPQQRPTSDAANLVQRRQGQDQEEALQGRQRAAQVSAERSDPTSETSKSTRAFFNAVDPKTVALIGPQFERMSHADVVEKFPYLQHMMRQKQKSQLDAAGEAAVDREILKIDPTFNPAGMPYEVKKAILDAKLRAGGQAATVRHQGVVEKQGATRLGLQGEIVQQGSERLGLKRQGQAFHVGQSEVPGVTPEDEQNPHPLQPAQAATLQGQKAAVESAQHAIDFAKATTAKYGRRFANPLDQEAQTALATVRSRLTEALPQLSAANGFGNPTQGHIELSHASMGGDPTDFINLMNQGRLPAVLDSVMESANERYRSTLHSSGQREVRPGEHPVRSPFKPSMPVKMRFPDGSTYDVGADEVELARRKGGVPL